MKVKRWLRASAVETLKLIVLVALIFALQNGVFDLRPRASVESDLARVHAHSLDTHRELRGLVERSASELRGERDSILETVARLDANQRSTATFIENRLASYDRTISEGLETECERLAGAASAIQRMSARLDRDAREMRERMILPTVQLRGNGTVGSGVIVYSELQPISRPGDIPAYTTFILTAHHVVLEVTGDRADARTVDEVHIASRPESDILRTESADMVLFDQARDLALLRLNSTERFPFVASWIDPDRMREIDVFSPAYAVGCPLGNHPLPTLGEISSRTKRVGSQNFWMLNAPTFFGNSGGGVFCAERSELIGVSSMIYTYGKRQPTVVPHMGLFVPASTVRLWLDDEGFSFLHTRRPIPAAKVSSLVYSERSSETVPAVSETASPSGEAGL